MIEQPFRIAGLTARQILDSRGRPTVEADVVLADGSFGRAASPSGASTGIHEAAELRDDDASVFGGRGVRKAVANVRVEIASALIGLDAIDQSGIDRALLELDGSRSLRRLGANAVLAVSLAVARAAANHLREPLYRYISALAGDVPMSMPMPMTNILSGGAHAGRGMDLQDFLVLPIGAESYSEALEMISRVRDSAAAQMSLRSLSVLLADEGGLSPGFARAEEALEFMVIAFEAAGLKPGHDVAIALDVAASELFDDGRYHLVEEKRKLVSAEMIDFLAGLVHRYPILSIEDALEQDDWSNWSTLSRSIGDIQIVGDDLFATNVERIRRGVRENVANAALVKLNQNGTLSGTLDAIAIARSAGYATVVSARSGETEDTFIADLAVGAAAGQIKIGSVRNSERLAKYNQLLRIEEEAGELPFAGVASLAGTRKTVEAA